MPEHHPMDRLHQHLDKAAQHGPDLHAETAEAVAARQAQVEQERQDGGKSDLPDGGR